MYPINCPLRCNRLVIITLYCPRITEHSSTGQYTDWLFSCPKLFFSLRFLSLGVDAENQDRYLNTRRRVLDITKRLVFSCAC